MNYEQQSALEVVIELLKEKNEPTLILSLIKEALELKGLNPNDPALITQVYTDVTASSDFVTLGNGMFDLKSAQSLDVYDRDGSFYGSGDTGEEENDNSPSLDDWNTDDDERSEDDDDIDEDDEDIEYEDDEEGELSLDEDRDPTDDDDEDDYLDEEKYNDIMDDYEDMYDNN